MSGLDKKRIAFDVDGCLIGKNDKPRKEIIALLKALSKSNSIIIWSGGGVDYAKRWGRRLKLDKYVKIYSYKITSDAIDIAIDDQDVKLGRYNIKV